jgi:uncharacterized protein (DUF433 family)
VWPGDAVRVGKTRVSLDTVIGSYNQGQSAEEIVAAYDALQLADVYSVIGFYLNNREKVVAYLKQREEEAEQMRVEWEAKHPPLTRSELLARRAESEKSHAPAGH